MITDNASLILWLTGLILITVIFSVLLLQLRFVHHPIARTLQAFIGFFVILMGNAFLKFESEVNKDVLNNPFGVDLKFSSGIGSNEWIVATFCVTAIILACIWSLYKKK